LLRLWEKVPSYGLHFKKKKEALISTCPSNSLHNLIHQINHVISASLVDEASFPTSQPLDLPSLLHNNTMLHDIGASSTELFPSLVIKSTPWIHT